MIKFYKIMFISTMIMGTLISISSYTWMSMWMGLEINLLSIIPLMNNMKNLFSSEASLKYFITQALASTLIIFSIIMMSNSFILTKNINNSMILIFNSGLLTKMGAAPFHFWFPEVMEGLSWMNCLILLTWQKIAPMILIMLNMNFPVFFSIIIIFSMLISGVLGINQTSLRKILTYSSINHITWMISAMFLSETTWTYYFIVYTIMSVNIIMILNILNIYFIKQLISSMNNNFIMKFLFILNFMSLGGLPPFIGFLPKWITIQNLIYSNFMLISFLMVMMTLITLYYYMRLTFSTLMINLSKINWMIKTPIKNFWILMSNIISIISLVICTMMFNIL